MHVTFSVNEYDYDGDIMEKGIYLHFNNTKIKVADTIEEYKKLVDDLESIAEELDENNYRERL